VFPAAVFKSFIWSVSFCLGKGRFFGLVMPRPNNATESDSCNGFFMPSNCGI
jgi:hypothetical protein